MHRLSALFDHRWALCAVFSLNGAFQSAELSHNTKEAASHGPAVPSPSPPCLPQPRGHTGAWSHPSRRVLPKRTTALTGGPSSVQTELPPLPEKADRQSERQVDRQASRGAGAPYTRGPLCVSRRACVLHRSQQGRIVRHVSGPSRHKQMFSGYCCSASVVIVFLQGQPVGQDARLRCGMELWRDGKTECIINQQTALKAATHRLSIFLLCAPCGLNYSAAQGEACLITIATTKNVLMVMASCHFEAVEVFVVQSGPQWGGRASKENASQIKVHKLQWLIICRWVSLHVQLLVFDDYAAPWWCEVSLPSLMFSSEQKTANSPQLC